jgi:hypothetical protein
MKDARPASSGTYRVTVEGAEPQVFELSPELLEPSDDQLVADTVKAGADQGDRMAGVVTVLKRPGDPGDTLTRYEVVVGGWRFMIGVEPAARAELRGAAPGPASATEAAAVRSKPSPIPGRTWPSRSTWARRSRQASCCSSSRP